MAGDGFSSLQVPPDSPGVGRAQGIMSLQKREVGGASWKDQDNWTTAQACICLYTPTHILNKPGPSYPVLVLSKICRHNPALLKLCQSLN
ncbi:hypothetical protein Y1Q_0021502 [Alligator mississippiensis]|uniref:Uncharacterized protein n=1 Tax=Alligator mississippiensis TaxID=8496 RepID=A0A151PAB2_ALLMI|nr:hypothetical protein Y1Q_0021502 [Alligator mississippiensis]